MDQVEERIIRRIEENRERIIGFARDIYSHGELGFKETRTAGKFEELLRELKLPRIDTGLALTGVKGYLKPGETGRPRLALIGELDALRIPAHPCANPETQGAHCCGHHAQLAGVAGAAFALADPETAAALDGDVVFFAVPAEEYGEIAFSKTSFGRRGLSVTAAANANSSASALLTILSSACATTAAMRGSRWGTAAATVLYQSLSVFWAGRPTRRRRPTWGSTP